MVSTEWSWFAFSVFPSAVVSTCSDEWVKDFIFSFFVAWGDVKVSFGLSSAFTFVCAWATEVDGTSKSHNFTSWADTEFNFWVGNWTGKGWGIDAVSWASAFVEWTFSRVFDKSVALVWSASEFGWWAGGASSSVHAYWGINIWAASFSVDEFTSVEKGSAWPGFKSASASSVFWLCFTFIRITYARVFSTATGITGFKFLASWVTSWFWEAGS